MTQEPQSKTSQQLKNEREVRKYLDELGNSEAVARLIDRYGKVSTKRVYLVSLVLYFRWLKSLGVVLSPGELVTDNLACVFHSDPADVRTKRKHTDWLSKYVNQWMVDQGYSEAMRVVTTAAVQQFYKKNDSPLFGDFGVSRSSPEPATDPLEPVDVRRARRNDASSGDTRRDTTHYDGLISSASMGQLHLFDPTWFSFAPFIYGGNAIADFALPYFFYRAWKKRFGVPAG